MMRNTTDTKVLPSFGTSQPHQRGQLAHLRAQGSWTASGHRKMPVGRTAIPRRILVTLLAVLLAISALHLPVRAAVDENEGPVALPPGTGRGRVLDLGTEGSRIVLDDLGPVIVNEDGTLSRIKGWADLSPREQEVAWRRINERNAKTRGIEL